MLLENILGAERRAPDILDCLSNLSSDEVFTPPSIAGRMLDLLPNEVWTNPDLKWLDPACKSGVFLREAAARLMRGLKDHFPDEAERREHIFKNMLYGIAITELTGHISRRSLYYSKDASGEHSVIPFKDSAGNILQRRSEHHYVDRKCTICGSPDHLDAEGREGLENYAYTFIHEKGIFEMKFDIIIGNPPYQLEDGGYGASATPIYQHFVQKAKDLQPRLMSFIIPARWYAGGKGLDDFRAEMIADRSISHLVDYPKLFEVFPGVEIKGGVCYFLWDREHNGDCEVTTVIDGERISSARRDLRQGGDVLIRSNEAVSILEKVRAKGEATLDSQVSRQKPFGMRTFVSGSAAPSKKEPIKVFQRGGIGYVSEELITKHPEWLPKWKTLTPRAADGHGRVPMKVLGESITAAPNEACTETYLVAGVYGSKKEAENLGSYLQTKFVRLLVSLRKHTQDVNQTRFAFVPKLDMTKAWTDEELYERYELTEDEILHIESQILEMS